jgi:BASS family bile acid:Na+ symporter
MARFFRTDKISAVFNRASPMPNDILSNILTPIALALMMTGMGLTLTPSDFTRLFKKPKAILVGLLGQMVGLPLLGFLVASLFALPALQSAGMMILVLRAGGVVSGLLTQMVKGDSALSITMTAISMLFGIFTIPLLVNASLHYFMQQNQTISLDLVNTSLRLLAITVLPVLAGMLLRHHF